MFKQSMPVLTEKTSSIESPLVEPIQQPPVFESQSHMNPIFKQSEEVKLCSDVGMEMPSFNYKE